jgi:hypothetical protein
MIYACTECENIIPQGKSWFFGKDYLFCSTVCWRGFLCKNPNIQNNISPPLRMPEQTPAHYCNMPLPPLTILPSSQISPPCSPPSSESYMSTALEYVKYTLCGNTYIKYITGPPLN